MLTSDNKINLYSSILYLIIISSIIYAFTIFYLNQEQLTKQIYSHIYYTHNEPLEINSYIKLISINLNNKLIYFFALLGSIISISLIFYGCKDLVIKNSIKGVETKIVNDGLVFITLGTILIIILFLGVVSIDNNLYTEKLKFWQKNKKLYIYRYFLFF